MGEKLFIKTLDLYGLDRLRIRLVTESGKVTYAVYSTKPLSRISGVRSFDMTIATDTPIETSFIQMGKKISSRSALLI